MPSILVTGNKGFIASGLSGDGIDIKDGVDILTYSASKQYDVVVHAAALTSVTDSMTNPKKYFETNVLGTLNMVKQHPEAHFVYLSTAGIYGEGSSHTVDSTPQITSFYAATKLFGEYAIQRYAGSWAILRLTNVIGPGKKGEPNVYQCFDQENVCTIYGDGKQTRDFIHVEYVRQAIYWAMRKHGIFNVGSGKSKTVLEVAEEFDKPIIFADARAGEIKEFGVKDVVDFNT